MLQKKFKARLSQEMAKMLRKLPGLKLDGDWDKALTVVNETCIRYFDFDIGYLDSVAEDQLITTLVDKQQADQYDLEAMAELLMEDAEISDNKSEVERSRMNYKKALLLLKYLEESQQTTFSLGRKNKIKEIEKHLKQ